MTSYRRPTLAQAKALGAPSTRGRFLRIHDVIATTGLSRSTIYRLVDEGELPRQSRITKGTVGWWEADVVAFNERRRTA